MAVRQLCTMFRAVPSSSAQSRRLQALGYYTQARAHWQMSRFHHPQLRTQLLQPSIRIPPFRWICTTPGDKGRKEETREKTMNSETEDDKTSGEKEGKGYEDMNDEEKNGAEKRDFKPLAPWLVTVFAAWYVQGSGRRKRKDWEDEAEANKDGSAQ